MAVLNEKTIETMQILNDCVAMLIDNLPYVIKADSVYGIFGDDLRGLGALRKKYQGTAYEIVLNAFTTHWFGFSNKASGVGVATMGAYTARPQNRLWINVSGLLGRSDDAKREDILAHRAANLPIKTFRAIVLHELRHLFQSYLYEKYFFSRPETEVYAKSPIEIDAAWNHHLEDFRPADYASVSRYVEDVMASFAGYKKLTMQQTRHYMRKTARYYLEAKHGAKQDSLTDPAKVRLVRNREATRQAILKALDKLVDTNIDLRSLPGYSPEATRFFFPANAVRSVAMTISGNKEVQKGSAAIVFLVLSMAIDPEQAAAVQRQLRGVQKITLQDALDAAPVSFQGGWDADAMIAQIKRVFG